MDIGHLEVDQHDDKCFVSFEPQQSLKNPKKRSLSAMYISASGAERNITTSTLPPFERPAHAGKATTLHHPESDRRGKNLKTLLDRLI
jgi:hypothetical protein